MSQTPPTGPPSFPPPPPPPPPPAGPPSFPPPAGPAGQAGGPAKGKGLWIVLAVVGVVVLIGVVVGLVLALTGDDSDDGDRADAAAGAPEDVVEELVDAAEDGDCAAAEKLLTAEARATKPCETEAFQLLATEDVESEVHDASIDGSTASVPADFTSPYGTSTYTFLLEKVDGAWLVASYDVARSATSESTGDASEQPSGSVTAPTEPASPSAKGSSSADAVPDDPAAVVEAFLDAAFSGDCATAEDLVTSEYLAAEGSCDAQEVPTAPSGQAVSWEVGDPTVDQAAGTATVPVELTVFGSTQESVFHLVREDGRWKLSDAG